MAGLRAVRPVPPSLALEFGGAAATKRRVLAYQARRCESLALMWDDEPLALAMLHRWRARRVEIAIAFRPAAAAHMAALVRFTQRTLTAIAHSGVLVFTRISPGAIAGQRMARLAGFRPGRMADPAIWLWRGNTCRGCSEVAATRGARLKSPASSRKWPTPASSPS